MHRELINKPIWKLSTPEQKTILITILCMINHEAREWEWKGKKYLCQPGQVITSLEKIKQECGKGVSIQNIRTAIARFEKLGFLTNESTKEARLITVLNWELYQFTDNNQQSIQQTGNKGVTTNKNNKINNNKNIYIVIFDYWNSKKIIVHKKLTYKIKRKISSALETYTEEEIKKAIDNYDRVLKGNEYYWSYKWTLEDFLQRGIEKFLTDACFQNYKKQNKPATQTNIPNHIPNKGNFDQRQYGDDYFDKLYKEV